MTHEQHAPEHVTDEELAEVERRLATHDPKIRVILDIAPDVVRRMAAELRALRTHTENSDKPFDFMMRTLAAGIILRPHVERAAVLARENACLRQREADIIEACERVADGGQYRADIIGAINRIRGERDRLAREAEGLRAEVAEVVQAAHDVGWNGVENSKILAVFIRDMGSDLAAARAEIERMRSSLTASNAATEDARQNLVSQKAGADAAERALRAEIERLKVIADAWKALAQAGSGQVSARMVKFGNRGGT